MKPLVSIFLAIEDGAELYVPDCIDSILGQTYTNFELICLAENSDYNHEDIQKKSVEDSRIGFGEPRSVGMHDRQEVIDSWISNAHGQYILFLNPRVLLEEDMLEIAVASAQKNHAEMVLFGGRTLNKKTGEVGKKLEYIVSKGIKFETPFSWKSYPNKLFQIASPDFFSKLFSRTFIKEQQLLPRLFQPEDDYFFIYALMSDATRMVALKEDLFRYRIDETFAVRTNIKDSLAFLNSLHALKEYLLDNDRFNKLENSFTYELLRSIEERLSSSQYDMSKPEIFDYLAVNWHKWLGFDWDADNPVYTDAITLLRNRLKIALEHYQRWNTPRSVVNEELKCLKRSSDDIAPEITVIVPAYNVEDYLWETLESIANQTFPNIEIICIDDGSTDGTQNVALDFANTDQRVSIYHQPNSGLSVARNAGIRNARGKYIYLIDSDDKLLPDALEILYEALKEDDLDVVFFDADSFVEEDMGSTKQGIHYESYYHRSGSYPEVLTGLDLMQAFFDNGDYLPSACLYIAKKDFIDQCGAFFIPGAIHEDNAYTFRLMLAARKVRHIPERLYLRRLRSNSIMTSKVRFDKVYGYHLCIDDMFDALLSGRLNGSACRAADAPLQIILNAASSAKNEYKQMNDEELGAVLALTDKEKKRFDRYIGRDGMHSRNLDTALKRLKHIKRTQSRSLKKRIARKVKRSISKTFGAK